MLPNHKLSTCYYGIVPEESWLKGNAHSAGYDAYMSAAIFEQIMSLGADIEDLIYVSKSPFIPRYCPITEEKGKPWDQVSDGLLTWMVNKRIWKEDEGLEIAILSELERRGRL